MGEVGLEDYRRLLKATSREPESLNNWKALAREAARRDFAEIELAPSRVRFLSQHLSRNPESLELGPLLLAALGLRIPEKPLTAPRANDLHSEEVAKGANYWYHSGSGLPLAAVRLKDQVAMRLVAPAGEPSFYLDVSWIRVGSFQLYSEETGRPLPEAWGSGEIPPHLPAVLLDHDQARAYAAWVGGALPLERQRVQGELVLGSTLPPPEEEFPIPRDIRECCSRPGRDWAEEHAEGWVEALLEAESQGSDLGRIHEWTANIFRWPPIPGDSEYFEKLEARYGTGAVVLGSCSGRTRQRYGADTTEKLRTLGFRVAVMLDGGEDPCLAQEEEHQRQDRRERLREQARSARFREEEIDRCARRSQEREYAEADEFVGALKVLALLTVAAFLFAAFILIANRLPK